MGMLPLEFSIVQLVSLGLGALLTGVRRGGIPGASILTVAIIGSTFSPELGLGLTLIIFLFADVQVAFIFFKMVNWRQLVTFLTPTGAGIAVAAVLGSYLSSQIFEWVIFSILALSFAGMLYQKYCGVVIQQSRFTIPLTLVLGFLAGFTTMIGNLSAIFVIIYFVMLRASKMEFVATSAWFFFIVNLIKLPVHLFLWHSIDREGLLATLIFCPLITLGIVLGRGITKKLSEERYWNFVVLIVAVGLLRYLIELLV